jgi:hypothetical protein
MGYKLNAAPVRSVYQQHPDSHGGRSHSSGAGGNRPVILSLQNKLTAKRAIAEGQCLAARHSFVGSALRRAGGHQGYCPVAASTISSIFGGSWAAKPGFRMFEALSNRTIGSLDTRANAKPEGIP